ncbi:mannose-specific lectin 3-like [Iris pallida]|uniref:Mannose-specific lectin 3-like n=1 Tax=Iris pallida TaxID=29817 RepID=A0AAX6G4B2_IRIPA|nr:mannose-specific lectin 3-like [Iris pallida]
MAVVISPSSTFLILSSVLLSTLFSPPLAFAQENNALLTGGVLATDRQLSYLEFSFVMQDDCNLVLYNKGSGFTSNTHRRGVDCSLTLNDLGQLVIRTSNNQTVWTSPVSATARRGSYAAVLRPDGQVAVYGPALWWTPALRSNASAAADADANGLRLAKVPMVKNVLFVADSLRQRRASLEGLYVCYAKRLQLGSGQGSTGCEMAVRDFREWT